MKKAPGRSITCIEGELVKMTSLALTTCLAGAAPSLTLAEVCLRGSSVPIAGLKPLLHGCAVGFAFEDSFGVTGVRTNNPPVLTVSLSGRPQVGISLEFDDLVDVLDSSSKVAGSSLDGATSEFEARLRKIVCGGGYDSFLNAGGSVRVALTALRNKAEEEPLKWPTERFTLIDFEIDSLEDCEAP